MTDMQDVDHTHPHTDEPFGEPFRRGPQVAADGGERSDGTRPSSGVASDGGARDAEPAEEQTMADVDHEASTEDTTRAFERGTEGRDESV